MNQVLQTALGAIYPPQCAICAAKVSTPFGLCAGCLPQMQFITSASCNGCGAPMATADQDEKVLCEDCHVLARPWIEGRAAIVYGGLGRRMVLALKHGDRMDLARAAGPWLARLAAPMMKEDTVFVPIPLHRWRLFERRYNQAGLLVQALAKELRCPNRVCLTVLDRPEATPSTDHKNRDARFSMMQGAIVPSETHGGRLKGRSVLLVDDVMTSGATFAAATEAAYSAGASEVRVLALARALKGGALVA